MRAYTKQVLLGLHYLHTQCLDGHYVMHRDIKVPSLPLQAVSLPHMWLPLQFPSPCCAQPLLNLPTSAHSPLGSVFLRLNIGEQPYNRAHATRVAVRLCCIQQCAVSVRGLMLGATGASPVLRQGPNLLVSTEGIVKLADFGASKLVEELASCGVGTLMGAHGPTPH